MTKVWLVTGSGVGLGRSIVEAALAAGHRVVATARNTDQLASLLEQHGDRLRTTRLDVTDIATAKAAMKFAVDEFGRIDVVVNNVGFAGVGSVEDMPFDLINSQFNTNFIGAVNVAKAALPILRKQSAGHLIFISSIGARVATPGAAYYYASKAALSSLAESLAEEVKPLGIKITALEPGAMRTRFAQDASLKWTPSHSDYDRTVGMTLKMMKSPEFAAVGRDPASVAKVVVQVADLDQPPIRMLVGDDAFEMGTAADRARAEVDAGLRHLSVSTSIAA